LVSHITQWPEETLTLPPLPAKIVKTSVLTGGTAEVKQSDAGVEISVPKPYRQEIDTIVVLELDRPAMEIKPIALHPLGPSLTTGKRASASTVIGKSKKYAAAMAVDDDESTRWATAASTRRPPTLPNAPRSSMNLPCAGPGSPFFRARMSPGIGVRPTTTNLISVMILPNSATPSTGLPATYQAQLLGGDRALTVARDGGTITVAIPPDVPGGSVRVVRLAPKR
jgi:hypothetical protein